MEPTSSTASAFALSKLWLAAGSAVGSGATGAFWQPAALAEYGKLSKGVIIGGVGVGAPVVTGGFILTWFGLDPYSADVAMFVGFCMSVLSLLFFVTVTNYFKKQEHKDVFEVVQDAKNAVSRAPAKTTVKKPTVKKVVKK